MQVNGRSNRTGHATCPCLSNGRNNADTLNLNGGQVREVSGMGVSAHGWAFARVPRRVPRMKQDAAAHRHVSLT